MDIPYVVEQRRILNAAAKSIGVPWEDFLKDLAQAIRAQWFEAEKIAPSDKLRPDGKYHSNIYTTVPSPRRMLLAGYTLDEAMALYSQIYDDEVHDATHEGDKQLQDNILGDMTEIGGLLNVFLEQNIKVGTSDLDIVQKCIDDPTFLEWSEETLGDYYQP